MEAIIPRGVLLASRVLHAWGLSRSSTTSFGRYWGTAGTWIVTLLLSAGNIYLAVAA